MNAERNDAETQDAKKHFWKDYAPIEKMTFVLATFTVVYSLITLGLLFIAMRQVDSMRKDQRPWVVEAIQIQQIPDKSTSIPIVTNTMNPGKTPAKSVFSEVFVERVKNGEEPRLSSTIPISTLSMGIMYPAGVQTWSVQY